MNERSAKPNRTARIRSRLEIAFQPETLEIIDDSYMHEGHTGTRGGKGHFKIRIVSNSFSGIRPVDRYRLVFDALGEMMRTDIHALSITALSATETITN